MTRVLPWLLTAELGTRKNTEKQHTPSINLFYKTSNNDNVCYLTTWRRNAMAIDMA